VASRGQHCLLEITLARHIYESILYSKRKYTPRKTKKKTSRIEGLTDLDMEDEDCEESSETLEHRNDAEKDAGKTRNILAISDNSDYEDSQKIIASDETRDKRDDSADVIIEENSQPSPLRVGTKRKPDQISPVDTTVNSSAEEAQPVPKKRKVFEESTFDEMITILAQKLVKNLVEKEMGKILNGLFEKEKKDDA
jgi:hypothetical protein